MRVNIYFKGMDQEFDFKYAEKIKEDRCSSIEDYMLMDAGVRPVKKGFAAYIVNKEEWKYAQSVMGTAIITEEGGAPFTAKAAVILRDERARAPTENIDFVHEVLGHIGFNKYIPLEKGGEEYRISEAFSRTLDLFGGGNQSLVLYHLAQNEAIMYPAGTTHLVSKSFTVYSRVGKRAVVSLFYSASPEPEGMSLIDRLYEDTELSNAVAVLSARYGGSSAGSLLRENERGGILKKANEVYDETTKKSGLSEHDLMFMHIKEEFSLGESFAGLYLKDVHHSCLEELIACKRSSLIENVSGLKWVWAHAGTDIPNHRRGLSLLDYFMGTVKNIAELDKPEPDFNVQHDAMAAYNALYGGGTGMEKKFRQEGVHYSDINIGRLWSKVKIPSITLKKLILGSLGYR